MSPVQSFVAKTCLIPIMITTSLLHHLVGLLHIPTATAVSFILTLALLYMQRLIATPTSEGNMWTTNTGLPRD